jgi:hypothetical protein
MMSRGYVHICWCDQAGLGESGALGRKRVGSGLWLFRGSKVVASVCVD